MSTILSQHRPVHWQYFGVLSDDLETTERYVAFSKENFKTHSIEFVRILLSVGSEVDVVAKLLCKKLVPTSSAKNIDGYRSLILNHYPGLPDVEVTMLDQEIAISPWEYWKSGTNPAWWRSYNDVKHERDKYFQDANLENCIYAMAGLLVLLGYLYGEDLSKAMLPSHRLFQFNEKYFLTARGLQRPRGYLLPGIPKPKLDSRGLPPEP
jgi:hypothetical protein